MTTFNYDFVSLCWNLFQLLVLGVLPLTAIVILAIYVKRILTALGEKKLAIAKLKQRQAGNLKGS